MSDTFHIKTINELLPNEPGIDERVVTYTHYLAGLLEQEHERNNQLEEKLLKEEESIAKHTFELECRINVLEKRIEELEHKSIPLADKIGLICPDCGAKYPASSFQSIDGTSKIWEARCSCGHEFSPPQRRE